MANCIFNEIRVKGNDEKELLEKIKCCKEDRLFEEFISMPKDLDLSNYRNWCLTNWGCKCDADELEIKEKKNSFVISFVTANDIPFAFIKHLTDNYDVQLKAKASDGTSVFWRFDSNVDTLTREEAGIIHWLTNNKDGIVEYNNYVFI